MTSSPFKPGTELDTKRVIRTLKDDRVFWFNLRADLQRRAELRNVLTAAAWTLAEFEHSKRLARMALIARAEGWHAKENPGRGSAGHLNNVIARYRKEWKGELPAYVLDWLEKFFRFGLDEAGRYKPCRKSKAIVTLMETPNTLDDNTARSRRRRAWHKLSKERVQEELEQRLRDEVQQRGERFLDWARELK
jgi:hypothetical protein